jgi:hypothetical protein
MSLINDALKRAAESQKQNPSDSPPKVPLQPVDYAARPSPLFRLLAVLALLALVAVSVWAFSKWWHTRQPMHASAVAEKAVEVEGASIESRALEPGAPRPDIKVSTNVVTRADSATASVAAAKPSVTAVTTTVGGPPGQPPPVETNVVAAVTNTPPSFPELKLQSIIYRLNKPAVVINGDMLHVGDVIKEARVTKIERYTVTVVWRGETNVLSLPRL